MDPSHTPFESPRSVGRSETSGMAITSMVLGLCSLATCFLAGIPAIILGILSLKKIGKSEGRLGGNGFAITGLVLGSASTALTLLVVPMLVALLLPAVQAAREAARRSQSSHNLKQVGLAMHNFHDVYGRLPAAGAANPADPAGGAGLSWRVHVLPFIGEQSLYKQFHLDEPWDSPHNKSLIPQMPLAYASPNFTDKPGHTIYLAVAGDPAAPWNTPFTHGGDPLRFGDIPDGLGNTIFVVEADPSEAVPWTKPDDLEIDPRDPHQGLGNLRPGGFLAAFGDGHTDFISNYEDDALLRSMFLIDDGQ